LNKRDDKLRIGPEPYHNEETRGGSEKEFKVGEALIFTSQREVEQMSCEIIPRPSSCKIVSSKESFVVAVLSSIDKAYRLEVNPPRLERKRADRPSANAHQRTRPA
jgi:hypothetical protein